MLFGAGRGRNGRVAAAIRPAPVATRIVSKNVFRPDLIVAFQLACKRAPSRTARTASLGIGPEDLRGKGSSRRKGRSSLRQNGRRAQGQACATRADRRNGAPRYLPTRRRTMTLANPHQAALRDRCAGIRGLLFDKDGTLLDYAASWGPVNRRAAADSVMSAGTAVNIAGVWVTGGAPYDCDSLARALDELFCAAVADMVPVTDLSALFERFKSRGFKLGIASSDSEAAVRATARVFG